ncbi:hypothetical protein MetfoDRAFT_0876 [Methanotorris formicicus Mc-S-70]|uniref:Uncharacterized protein n=1 Tax=Methanotorris formicicus Mc-S-70 TaxID=647171 RepID=H1KYK3_9EURY|nr:hypothetical protein MetfoDRAFT_0876 [Methanotorris formicicus Mc-S-70]
MNKNEILKLLIKNKDKIKSSGVKRRWFIWFLC